MVYLYLSNIQENTHTLPVPLINILFQRKNVFLSLFIYFLNSSFHSLRSFTEFKIEIEILVHFFLDRGRKKLTQRGSMLFSSAEE